MTILSKFKHSMNMVIYLFGKSHRKLFGEPLPSDARPNLVLMKWLKKKEDVSLYNICSNYTCLKNENI